MSLTGTRYKAIFVAALIASVCALSACDKAVVTQPSKPAAAANAPAPQTFTAESFSTKGLEIVEGKDYTKIANPQPVAVAGKAEVAEFFWYGCGHCYAVEPAVEAWKKTIPANVNFVRYHAQWNAAMQSHQRMAMTVQALGKSDALDMKIFQAIQEQGKSLTSEENISAFMVQNGVDKAAWDKAYKGFEVNAAIMTADNLFKTYQLDGVPDFIVNGKYLVKGDTARALRVVNKLLEQNSK